MATSSAVTTAGVEAHTPFLAEAAREGGVPRRRRVSPESGRALEILGHAIEYLTDEYMHQGGQFNLSDPRVEAVMLLMERNRDIYYACPEVPTIGQRLRNFWNRPV